MALMLEPPAGVPVDTTRAVSAAAVLRGAVEGIFGSALAVLPGAEGASVRGVGAAAVLFGGRFD